MSFFRLIYFCRNSKSHIFAIEPKHKTFMKMKKQILIIAFCMFLPISNLKATPVDVGLQTSIINPTSQIGGHPKSPIQVPGISLDDHTLYFDTPCDGCTLNIVDENDVVVYTTVIPTGTTSLVLPSTLSGEYIIEIIRGNYCFWGLIEF